MVRKRYFGDRLNDLPLILAGPILRQVDSSSMSVWFALKQPAKLTLQGFATLDGLGGSLGSRVLEANAETVQIGDFLHLALITAYGNLSPSQIYAYDVEIETTDRSIASLASLPPSLYGNEGLSYFSHGLPTFATASSRLEDLKLMHGSCRKPHGKGADMLVILDDLLQASAGDPKERIQQLFFTGDQIYGDDVADPLLWVATDVGDMLLGWTEILPVKSDAANGRAIASFELVPGVRTEYAKEKAGLTSTIGNSDEIASSHLFSFGEYLATYLLGWSPYLWPNSFPSGSGRKAGDSLHKTMGQGCQNPVSIYCRASEGAAIAGECRHLHDF
ncbi:MAG: hypothetical protein HC810_03240 [Acaryochloridaceae cyanobacterium RL_2_7]|nr:hypothetical protein [Acaryochloridaceae cyanobacterium RL_2_7]